MSLYEEAASRGNCRAIYNLALCYGCESNEKDQEKSNSLLSKAAELGSPDANYTLGFHYKRGDTHPQSMEKAVELFRRAALLGNTGAMTNLAYCINHGQGHAQDSVEALKWYKKAAGTLRNSTFAQDFLTLIECLSQFLTEIRN